MKNLVQLLTIITLIIHSLTTNAQSLLWEISGNGLKKPSYIYGTIHLICPNELVISDALIQAFDRTDQLVLELDMDAPDFMQKAQKLSLNPSMENLSNQLNVDNKKLINSFLQKNFKTDLTQLGILKPFALQSMVLMKTLECQQPASYESSFIQLAKEQKEEILGLEEMEDQFKIFDEIPQKKQVEWLVENIKNFTNTKKEMQEILKAYENEDLKKIQEITIQNPQYKEYLDLF